MRFDELRLHDATLLSIEVDYGTGRCELLMHPVGEDRQILVFDGISALCLPRQAPWGRSSAINALRQPDPQAFEIELQSGDVLRIEAAGWSSVKERRLP
ncbi:hypothetical protein ACQ86G_19755 [Roseateles chitinivorans]|uniref:hypothetical protein n=1 Tax=Roseateles chitinivorans TaxID=2917965 RepID=UPI003D6746C2